MINFHPPEATGRCSEIQLPVADNLNYLTQRSNPLKPEFTIVIFIHYKPPTSRELLSQFSTCSG